MNIQINISVPTAKLVSGNPLGDFVPLDLTLHAAVSVPVEQVPVERYEELYKRWQYHHESEGALLATSVSGKSVLRLMAAVSEEILKIVGGNTPAERFISEK